MLINEQTKIAVLIKHNPAALEAIVPLSPDFNKLRNPVLRKLMAGRTSIGMAAKIGGCTPDDFFKALSPLGFEVDAKPALVKQSELQVPVPEILKHLEPEQLIALDVRPVLASGQDPLELIQKKIKELLPGQVLQIINSFEPTPLILLLRKQGLASFVNRISKDQIETYFYKTSATQLSLPEAGTNATGDWDELLRNFDGQLEVLDVRHLVMPGPMMAILEALAKLPETRALYVHHKRIPVYLLDELKSRKFEFRIREVREGEVYLLIFKNA